MKIQEASLDRLLWATLILFLAGWFTWVYFGLVMQEKVEYYDIILDARPQ